MFFNQFPPIPPSIIEPSHWDRFFRSVMARIAPLEQVTVAFPSTAVTAGTTSTVLITVTGLETTHSVMLGNFDTGGNVVTDVRVSATDTLQIKLTNALGALATASAQDIRAFVRIA